MTSNSKPSVPVQFKCAQCHVSLNDALILVCNHNLCLPCAAKSMKHQKYNPKSYQSCALKCQICNAITNVDAESATHLVENVATQDSDPDPNDWGKWEQTNDWEQTVTDKGNYKTVTDKENYQNAQQNKPANSANNRVTRGVTVADVTSMCPSHPDEPLQFFCLDCECKCICAECVIHGVHKDHEVLNVKKAYPILLSKVSSLNVELRERMSELNSVAQSWERKQREMLNTQEAMKLKITEQFAEIRKLLAVKENEMKRLMGDGMRDGLNFAENKMNEIRELIQELKDAQVQMQNNTTNRSSNTMQNAVESLNWYADSRLSLNQLLVTELPFPTESSKPNEWLVKYGENCVARMRDLQLKVQQLG